MNTADTGRCKYLAGYHLTVLQYPSAPLRFVVFMGPGSAAPYAMSILCLLGAFLLSLCLQFCGYGFVVSMKMHGSWIFNYDYAWTGEIPSCCSVLRLFAWLVVLTQGLCFVVSVVFHCSNVLVPSLHTFLFLMLVTPSFHGYATYCFPHSLINFCFGFF